jgi:hypothetical protein
LEVIVTMLIMCKLFSRIGAEGQPALNVFGYRSFLVVANELDAFANKFLSDVVPDIQALTTTTTFYDRIEAYDLGDPTGEFFLPIIPAIHGGNGGERLPPWLTASFEYRRKNRTQRSGRKGFGQLAESAQEDGIVTGTFQTSADATAAVLAAPIKVGLIDTWFPVILHRPTPPSTLWVAHDLQTVLFKGLGTQNTRKRR